MTGDYDTELPHLNALATALPSLANKLILSQIISKAPTAYHCTSMEALLGMVKGDSLHASHSRYMNDVREGVA